MDALERENKGLEGKCLRAVMRFQQLAESQQGAIVAGCALFVVQAIGELLAEAQALTAHLGEEHERSPRSLRSSFQRLPSLAPFRERSRSSHH